MSISKEINHGIDWLLERFDYFYFAYAWPVLVDIIDPQRREHFKAMGKFLNIKESDQVLELGSNRPWYTEYSRNVGNTGKFVAVDLYHNIQKQARKQLLKEKRKSGESHFPEVLVTANAEILPFSDNSFDAVSMNNLFDDVGIYKTMAETYRVLKPGGRVVIAFYDYKSTVELKTICSGQGFETEDIIASNINHLYNYGENWMFKGIKPIQR